MYRYKRLLVGLDLSDQDQSIIRYAALASRMARSEKIYFVHAIDNRDVPDGLRI